MTMGSVVFRVDLQKENDRSIQDTFAETLCYNMILGEVVLPLVAPIYILGLSILFL
jgi:hypothetical protein